MLNKLWQSAKTKAKAISPEDVAKHKAQVMPEFVIEAFNDAIAKNFSGRSAKVTQDEVIELIMEKAQFHDGPDVAREDIFKNGWLNVEEVFEEAGWDVEYDKPGYNESYSAYFIFKQKIRGGCRPG